MTQGIYAIHDRLSQQLIGGLYLFPHAAPATRFFCDVAADPQTAVFKHADDYELLELGVLDDQNIINSHTQPVVIITGSAFKASQAMTNPAPP